MISVTYEPISKKDEPDLVYRAKVGDKKALDKLYRSVYILVKNDARRFGGMVQDWELEDMIQAGMLRIKNALDNFEPEQGIRFSTFARYHWMHGIRREKYKQKGRGLGGLGAMLSKYSTEWNRIVSQMSDSDDAAVVLSEKADIPLSIAEAFLASRHCHIDIAAFGEGQIGNDISGQDKDALAQDTRAILMWVIDSCGLTRVEERVIRMCYLNKRVVTQNKLAEVLGVSRQRVGQIHDKAIEKIRDKALDYKEELGA